jgi:predicted transcriptional regulator
MRSTSESTHTIDATAEIVSAYVSHNSLPTVDMPALIQSVRAALVKIAGGIVVAAESAAPAITIRKSNAPDFLVCLDDGLRFKSLKRHLSTRHGMTPDQYREKWGLPTDYPMVAANYAAERSKLAKQIGFGQMANRSGKPTSKPKRGRPPKVTTEAAVS